MRRLLLLSLLICICLAQNSTYVAVPGVPIRTFLPNTKLNWLNSTLNLDLTNGISYLQTYITGYNSTGYPVLFPKVTLVSDVTFGSSGTITFSYPDEGTAHCQQALSAPPLCPYLVPLTTGTFTFGAKPNDLVSPTLKLTISQSNAVFDPATGLLRNFMGAQDAITFHCVGSCAPLGPQVPPIQISGNASLNVRRCQSF